MAANIKRSKAQGFRMPVVSVLLENAQYSFDIFTQQFSKKWHIDVEPYRDKDALGMIIDGRVIGCAFIPRPVEDATLQQSALGNVLWPDAAVSILKHKAHLRATMTREGDPLAANILFSKVLCSLLQQKNAIGVHLRPGLLEPAYYMKYAEGLLDGGLPTELWVHIQTLGFGDESGFSLFTSGMRKFGKKEFEVVKSGNNFIDVYYSLRDLIKYTIENDLTFANGDTIGPSGNKLSLSVSAGVNTPGSTVKIGQ
ncbi:MAG: DUF4261 domain-containing protein [Clostridiales bacterium]|nr:DUF4261 domain-containing protein [Clostridiales bacterium]